MERELLNYLPDFMKEEKEMQTLMQAEQMQIDHTWEACESARKDQFIQEATEHGIKRWEKNLKIQPKDTDTLEERRFRVFAQINTQLPYTYHLLEQLLKSLCGEDGVRVLLSLEHYSIHVKLALSNWNNYSYVCKLLDRLLPCNMIRTVSAFNTNAVLLQATHEQLSNYTHQQLREDVIL